MGWQPMPRMIKRWNILDRVIGTGERTFVIAEIGVNHDGSLARALELVRTAAECGADAVKLQVFTAKSLMHDSASFADYQRERAEESNPTAMLRKYELPPLDLACVIESIRAQGMVPLATPFSLSDLDTLAALDLPAVKIASPDLVNRPLLQRVAQLRRPLLLSTGAATMDEVVRAVEWLREWRASVVLLASVRRHPPTNTDDQP